MSEPSSDTLKVAQHLIATKGYIVVGFSHRLDIGHVVNDPWNVNLGQSFVVISECPRTEWREQVDETEALMGRAAHPDARKFWRGFYYRAVTD